VARLLHAAAVGLLAALYWLTPLHAVYLAGVAGVALLLVYEHSLVRPDDLSRVDAAFFAANGWVSLGYFAATLAAVMLA
jgi:4-hydroxybenzoate polyprenyltransferase